jgi:hypothetical protein
MTASLVAFVAFIALGVPIAFALAPRPRWACG